MMSPRKTYTLTGQGLKSQKHCPYGSLHSCECRLFLVGVMWFVYTVQPQAPVWCYYQYMWGTKRHNLSLVVRSCLWSGWPLDVLKTCCQIQWCNIDVCSIEIRRRAGLSSLLDVIIRWHRHSAQLGRIARFDDDTATYQEASTDVTLTSHSVNSLEMSPTNK